jgi:hypothetical protein
VAELGKDKDLARQFSSKKEYLKAYFEGFDEEARV